MHRIPKNLKIRKIWLERISCKHFTPNASTRLCSYHFPNGYASHKDLPSRLPHRTYSITKFGESAIDCVVSKSVDSLMTKPGPSLQESLGNGTQWSASLLMHDYCGPVSFEACSTSTLRDSGTQTQREVATVVHLNDCEAQTEVPATVTEKEPVFKINITSLSDEEVLFYTGLPSGSVFKHLCNIILLPVAVQRSCKKLSGEEDIFLVFMKLRLNLMFQDLAYRFGVSKATVSRIFANWISIMSVRLSFLCEWPSQEVVRFRQPSCFNGFGFFRWNNETNSQWKTQVIHQKAFISHKAITL